MFTIDMFKDKKKSLRCLSMNEKKIGIFWNKWLLFTAILVCLERHAVIVNIIFYPC